MYQDWIDKKDPAVTVAYDVRNPPASAVIATHVYSGPPLLACGQPTLTFADTSTPAISLDFLTFTFDAATLAITISLTDLDKAKALKGNYVV